MMSNLPQQWVQCHSEDNLQILVGLCGVGLDAGLDHVDGTRYSEWRRRGTGKREEGRGKEREVWRGGEGERETSLDYPWAASAPLTP